LPEIQVFTRFL